MNPKTPSKLSQLNTRGQTDTFCVHEIQTLEAKAATHQFWKCKEKSQQQPHSEPGQWQQLHSKKKQKNSEI